MFPIVGQTAGPKWLNFFVGTHGWPVGFIGKKKFDNFFPWATSGPSASKCLIPKIPRGFPAEEKSKK